MWQKQFQHVTVKRTDGCGLLRDVCYHLVAKFLLELFNFVSQTVDEWLVVGVGHVLWVKKLLGSRDDGARHLFDTHVCRKRRHLESAAHSLQQPHVLHTTEHSRHTPHDGTPVSHATPRYTRVTPTPRYTHVKPHTTVHTCHTPHHGTLTSHPTPRYTRVKPHTPAHPCHTPHHGTLTSHPTPRYTRVTPEYDTLHSVSSVIKHSCLGWHQFLAERANVRFILRVVCLSVCDVDVL